MNILGPAFAGPFFLFSAPFHAEFHLAIALRYNSKVMTSTYYCARKNKGV